MTWRIDELAAGQVVLDANTMASGYTQDAESLGVKIEALCSALAKSDFVYAAVDAWAANCGDLGLKATQAVTNTAISAVSDAIGLYRDAQLEMAATAQQQAAAAQYPVELPKADGSANPVPGR